MDQTTSRVGAISSPEEIYQKQERLLANNPDYKKLKGELGLPARLSAPDQVSRLKMSAKEQLGGVDSLSPRGRNLTEIVTVSEVCLAALETLQRNSDYQRDAQHGGRGSGLPVSPYF